MTARKSKKHLKSEIRKKCRVLPQNNSYNYLSSSNNTSSYSYYQHPNSLKYSNTIRVLFQLVVEFLHLLQLMLAAPKFLCLCFNSCGYNFIVIVIYSGYGQMEGFIRCFSLLLVFRFYCYPVFDAFSIAFIPLAA